MAGDGGDWKSFLASEDMEFGVSGVGEGHDNASVVGFMGSGGGGLVGDFEEGEVDTAQFGDLTAPRVPFVCVTLRSLLKSIGC